MTIDELSGDLAVDITKGESDLSQIDPIFITLFSELIIMAIKWFLQNYQDDIEKAVQEFIKYFKNLGFWGRLRWGMKVREVTRNYRKVNPDKFEIAETSARKFANLNDKIVMGLFRQVLDKN